MDPADDEILERLANMEDPEPMPELPGRPVVDDRLYSIEERTRLLNRVRALVLSLAACALIMFFGMMVLVIVLLNVNETAARAENRAKQADEGQARNKLDADRGRAQLCQNTHDQGGTVLSICLEPDTLKNWDPNVPVKAATQSDLQRLADRNNRVNCQTNAKVLGYVSDDCREMLAGAVSVGG